MTFAGVCLEQINWHIPGSSAPCRDSVTKFIRLRSVSGFERRLPMILEYIQAALSRAQYEIIEDEESYYGEIPELTGVWATGKTLEECRKNLAEVLDGWIVIHLKRGIPIPPIGEYSIEEITRMETGAPA
jgi:predicted RNase H-like HicB family nuclease